MTIDLATLFRKATQRLLIKSTLGSPPSVKDLLERPEQVMTRFQGDRVNNCRTGSPTDTPLASLYRLYQFFVVGWVRASLGCG